MSGLAGNELAGVVYEGELLDVGRDAIGGFWSVVTSEDFTVTEVVRRPRALSQGGLEDPNGPVYVGGGRFPLVLDEALVVAPGTYTLVLWTDGMLGFGTRWVPVNTDGRGLLGCQLTFEVRADAQTRVTVSPTLHPDGWDTDCTSGQTIPGTAPWPPFDHGGEAGGRAVSMPPPTGTDRGQTVAVSLQDVSGHVGHELAGVLYEGQLTDIGRDAIGGFWSGITSDDFTLTEVVRTPRDDGDGRFPSVIDEALVVEPGTYTLVLWADVGLNSGTRWVPVNTDGQGLFGCQMVFEVGADAQTHVTVSPTLQPDGWNADCLAS